LYFGSVRFFKHVIVGVTILLIVIPCVFCAILAVKLNEAEAENKELRTEVADYRVLGHKGEYSAEELFDLYKENLTDKDGFLKLASEYDTSAYNAAAQTEESGEAVPVNAETDSSETTTTSASAAVTTTEGIKAVSIQIDDEEDEEEDPGFETTAAHDPEVVITNVHPAYESLYPDLYAAVPENLVYNADMDYVYLTFDDGPSKYTDSILEYLRIYDLKATFFVVPDGTDECAAKLRKIANAGHTIGIHTATHDYTKIYASVEAYLEDFKIAYDRVYDATGIKCNLFRFPGGSINDFNKEIRSDLIAEMTRRGFVYFDWNVDSSDALGATWTEMYNTVLKQTAAANRAVILMHDYNGGWNTILVLEDIIKALLDDKRGYKLDKLTEYVKPVQF
jgi:peptidoglycan/xylan/chitin deacetylase (PgdA/CDA1 family)